MAYVQCMNLARLLRRFILTLLGRPHSAPTAGAASGSRRSGAASPDRMQSGAGGVNQMFTFSLPAVREASFKWQVTYNFEARLLVIPAPGFSLSG